jgi:fructan beta-fructosidase
MNLMRSFIIVLALSSPSFAADDLVVADFEGDTYGDWTVTGEAFGAGPARGALPGQMPVDGFQGRGLVNSFFQGDRTTGTLTSPKFRIERRYLRFLLGGGHHLGETGLNLKVGGKEVRTITGPNDRPGGTEHLEWAQWDVAEFVGKEVVLEIVDRHTGGWGHINVDHILQTDQRLPELKLNVGHDLVAARRFLHLPVRTGAPKRRVKLELSGQTVREFEIELADRDPEFFVFVDLQSYSGQPLKLVVDKLPEDSQAFALSTTKDDVPDGDRLYREPLRPQFHFSSRRGWNNDPNGMVYHAGEYHLYYQHNPYGWAWGNMHWGHAVSRDLVHWEELPIALYPHKYDDWAFSGSAVVDAKNTSGFKTSDDDVLVLAYTSTGRGECIAFSNDRGRTWTEYPGNPVVKHRGRDPRLLWHAASQQWVMAVYHEPEVNGKVLQTIAFHTSPDLKAWTYHSEIEGFFECPDLFELAVDGDAARKLWLLSGANGDYLLGQFDGREFQPQSKKLKGHYGNAFYAAQTFSDIPATDGRRIQIGWGTAASPGMPFNQMMTFPTELTLKTTPEGPRLHYAPVREIESLFGNQASNSGAVTPLQLNHLELADVSVVISPQKATSIEVSLRGTPIRYDVQKQQLTCRDRTAPVPLKDGKLALRCLIDRTSFEIFADDGAVYMPLAVISPADNRELSITARDGTARIDELTAREIKSAWPRK